MSSSKAEEATSCGGDRGALKRRATPGSPGDASRAGQLDVPALVDAHFVSLVRGYEELYMSEHPLYADRRRRRAVWEEIGTIVDQPAGDCRKRWLRIRENYFRSVKRVKRQANEAVYQPDRPAHEKLLSFLNPTFETTTTVLDSDKEAPESENDDSSDGDNSLSEEKHSSDVSDSSSSDDMQGLTTQAPAPGQQGLTTQAPAPGQQGLTTQAPAPGQQQLEHDDIVDFFVELGESVKDFPEGVRIHVKREAFKIVTDAEEMLYHQKIKAEFEMNMSRKHE